MVFKIKIVGGNMPKVSIIVPVYNVEKYIEDIEKIVKKIQEISKQKG